ncbi:MAG: FG-GAP-like repeat-containing protein, partial [Planctomycetia bacterium]|nr:FG-GAP-like repeat-containing protein [Planctomycetia bacterium]
VADNTGYQIGGTAAGEGNVISGNGFAGLTLNAVANSFVQGNKIGVGADGITPLGNGDAGLFISSQAGPNTNNLIGGPGIGAANIIAFNDKNGITMRDPGGTGNRFQANSIFENGLLGIDLGNNASTANDTGDADTGENGLQNKPVLAFAPVINGLTRVNGSLNSIANETFRIELFSVPIADATGGEGKFFIGAIEVTTDASGNADFQVLLTVPEGTVISTTATRLSTNDTSEFSNNVTALTAQGGTVTGAVFNDSNGDGVRQGNESGIPGVVVFLDADGNGLLNGESAAFSGSDGSFVLSSPVDGSFTIVAVPPAGSTVTTPATDVTLSGNTTVNGIAIGVQTPSPPAPPAPHAPANVDLFAVATGPGVPVQVNVFNANGSLRFALQPFHAFSGGATVATGDVTGDGVDDVVVGAGAGAPGGHVKVFDGATGAEIRSFLVFGGGFAGGVFVGAGDVTGDGRADFVVGAGAGAPHVKVFDGQTGALVHSFLAYENFGGGVSVRAGDINDDGFADIVTGAGPGAGPHVKVFDGRNLNLLASFFAGDPANTDGVLVGVGNFVASGRPEVVASVSGRVSVFGFNQQGNSLIPFIEQDNIVPFAPGIVATPAAIRLESGIIAILIGAVSQGAQPHVKIIDGTSNTFSSFFAFDPAFLGGVNVG